MPIRTVATLAIAILFGVIAVILVRNYISTAKAPQGAVATGVTPVVVAAAPIERGKAIEPVQLKVVNYPANAVPAGAFRTVADLAGAAADKRVALRSITANEPILPEKVSGPGGRLVLSASLTPGMRAVSLRSSDVAGVAGFVLPGDRVDILLTRSVANTQVTQVLAQNVRVLGVDQLDDEAANKPLVAHAVTVEVAPAQAEQISLAQAVGAVSLALRHASDEVQLTKVATTVPDLGFSQRRPATVSVRRHAAHGAEPSISVVRGLETASYRVP